MKLGGYARYGLVTLCGLFLFFLGSSLPFQTDLLALASLFAIALLTVALSYGNRTPLGGLFLGIYTSTAFLLGFFLMACVWEISTSHPYIVGPIGKDWGLFLILQVLEDYGLGMLSAVAAFASTGLFFGLLGYVSSHIAPYASVTQPSLFRDYWSNINSLGKSSRREYTHLDRRPNTWRIGRREWWQRILGRITEPEPDLVFVGQRKDAHQEGERGDLFDLSSGRMIADGIVNPNDLISQYRPMILKVAEHSSNPKGTRRLALEELLARFLGRFLSSRVIWLLYVSISTILVFLAYVISSANLSTTPYGTGSELLVVGSAIMASMVTLFFVWRWRKTSKELFEKRPDERVLILMVHAILASLSGFYLGVISNPPTTPEVWVGSWSIWSQWLLFLSLLLGFGYICIHRECEMANVYFYDNAPSSEATRITSYRESCDEPQWVRSDQSKGFWILRFMYFWRYELAQIPHPDWERVEVWVDAKDGKAKWVVSDYHFRELWYKVEGDLKKLYVKFFLNFHTPVPVINPDEAALISHVFDKKTRELIGLSLRGRATEVVDHLRSTLESPSNLSAILHPKDWIGNYGLPPVAAGFCSKLDWSYWRYPHGIEDSGTYLKRPAVDPQDQPAVIQL